MAGVRQLSIPEGVRSTEARAWARPSPNCNPPGPRTKKHLGCQELKTQEEWGTGCSSQSSIPHPSRNGSPANWPSWAQWCGLSCCHGGTFESLAFFSGRGRSARPLGSSHQAQDTGHLPSPRVTRKPTDLCLSLPANMNRGQTDKSMWLPSLA